MKVEAQELVHGPLRKLSTALPPRERRFVHLQRMSELFLGQAKRLAAPTDFLTGEQPRCRSEGFADLFVGFIIQNDGAALTTAENVQSGDGDGVRASVVHQFGLIVDHGRNKTVLPASSTFPGKGFHWKTPHDV